MTHSGVSTEVNTSDHEYKVGQNRPEIPKGGWRKNKKENKNWVTVRDKCPQINVQFKWHTFSKKIFFSNGRTNGRTDGQSDFIMPQILFGGLKTGAFILHYKSL